MSKRTVQIALIIMMISGCQGRIPALDEAATMVAETVTSRPPTATPTASSTPLPTNTPTPLPTSTPNIGATATAQASDVLSEVSALVDDDIPYVDGHLAWKQTEPVTIEMSGPQGNRGVFREIDKNLSAGDFIFKSDITWNASGIIICGTVFRSESDIEKGKQYQIYFYRLSGLPAYFIDVFDQGFFKNTITDAKFSKELDTSNDATNQFTLVAQGEQFNVYVNGKYQGRYFDYSNQRTNGLFSFLAWQQSGIGSCKFENSWIWAIN